MQIYSIYLNKIIVYGPETSIIMKMFSQFGEITCSSFQYFGYFDSLNPLKCSKNPGIFHLFECQMVFYSSSKIPMYCRTTITKADYGEEWERIARGSPAFFQHLNPIFIGLLNFDLIYIYIYLTLVLNMPVKLLSWMTYLLYTDSHSSQYMWCNVYLIRFQSV